MADNDLGGDEPLDREGQTLAWRLLELRHLLVTGRLTTSETRKQLQALAKPLLPPAARPEDN